MRTRRVVFRLLTLALVAGGAALAAFYILSSNSQNNVSTSPESTQQVQSQATVPPEDTTLKVTVPKLARVEDAPVPDAEGDDEDKLKNYAAIHLQGTGFPWQEEANVYIAGHRLGYPGYPSFLAFYDLDNLEKGDEITVTDADGEVYVYRVSREFVASPTDLSVTEPVEGKDVLTLQTCTLPDYSQRLVVQAEKVV